jgi:hypothetical protein
MQGDRRGLRCGAKRHRPANTTPRRDSGRIACAGLQFYAHRSSARLIAHDAPELDARAAALYPSFTAMAVTALDKDAPSEPSTIAWDLSATKKPYWVARRLRRG